MFEVRPFCKSPRCDKCGSKIIVRMYHPAHWGVGCKHYVTCDGPRTEHHAMCCHDCGYTWVERCIDVTDSEPRGIRARAAAKGVTLATPPDSQREIDLRTGKRMGPDPVEGGEE